MTATVERQHGTRAMYYAQRCRCDDCRRACRDYERERVRRKVPAYVGADRARQHVKELSEAGVGWKRVAETAGLHSSVLWKLIYGSPQRKMGPSKRIRRTTEQAILAVTVEAAAAGSREPAGPTWEIVEQLLARGWQKAEIGRRIAGPKAVALQLGREFVTRKNARIIRALLDEPVPPRRSRHGLHPVPLLEVETEEAAARTVAERERSRRHQAEYRHPNEPTPDPWGLNLDPFPEGIDLSWRAQGACRYPDIPSWVFFPSRGDNSTAKAARAICACCPVVEECLDFALVVGEKHGIWGGKSERERRQLRRERAVVPA